MRPHQNPTARVKARRSGGVRRAFGYDNSIKMRVLRNLGYRFRYAGNHGEYRTPRRLREPGH
jgi:hypothetical protein